MALISVNDLRRGMVITYEGKLSVITFAQHVKPGKGVAFVKTKIKNFETGAVVEKNFRSNEKVEQEYIETREMQFLYANGTDYTFMDEKNYEQIIMQPEDIGDAVKYLKEETVCEVDFHKDNPVAVRLPTFVVLKVVMTEPGHKGDTVQNIMKPATLETDAEIQVPNFVNIDDTIKVDTRDGSYVERV